jgi:hypothetical protein
MTRKALFALLIALMVAAVLPPADAGGRRVRPTGCSLKLSDDIEELGEVSAFMSGNDEFGRAMQMASIVLQSDFGVSVPMLFLDDGRSPNAYYHPGNFTGLLRELGLDPALYKDRGLVLIGKTLMKGEQRAGRWHGTTAILAHEYAHAMQAKRHCPLTGKWRELHADLMAGWFTAREHRVVRREDITGFFAIADKGDYSFGSRDHHGTPSERGAAFMLGYQYKDERDASRVYREGLEHIASRMR